MKYADIQNKKLFDRSKLFYLLNRAKIKTFKNLAQSPHPESMLILNIENDTATLPDRWFMDGINGVVLCSIDQPMCGGSIKYPVMGYKYKCWSRSIHFFNTGQTKLQRSKYLREFTRDIMNRMANV